MFYVSPILYWAKCEILYDHNLSFFESCCSVMARKVLQQIIMVSPCRCASECNASSLILVYKFVKINTSTQNQISQFHELCVHRQLHNCHVSPPKSRCVCKHTGSDTILIYHDSIFGSCQRVGFEYKPCVIISLQNDLRFQLLVLVTAQQLSRSLAKTKIR